MSYSYSLLIGRRRPRLAIKMHNASANTNEAAATSIDRHQTPKSKILLPIGVGGEVR